MVTECKLCTSSTSKGFHGIRKMVAVTSIIKPDSNMQIRYLKVNCNVPDSCVTSRLATSLATACFRTATAVPVEDPRRAKTSELWPIGGAVGGRDLSRWATSVGDCLEAAVHQLLGGEKQLRSNLASRIPRLRTRPIYQFCKHPP